MKQRRSDQHALEKKYLDTLQRESWNLELIISGLAIFGLVAAWDQLDSMSYLSKIVDKSYTGSIIFIGLLVMMVSGIIVFINLLIHFLIRGLWIGAVGLRSVSGDIDYYQLKLVKKYQGFLRGRIGSFDDYILRLDRFCSMIFAFSFMLAFLLVGFILYCVGISLIVLLMQQIESVSEMAAVITGVVLTVLYLLFGLLYFVDFITLGWIKRQRWLAKVYYPFYRFFGFITLARVYRPLYYNFIDNAFGRRMIRISIPYIVLLLFATSATINAMSFYNQDLFKRIDVLQGKFVSADNYTNLRDPEKLAFPDLLLDSDVVTGPVLKVMIAIQPKHESTVRHFCPDLPIVNPSVIGSELVLGFNQHDFSKGDGDEAAKFYDCVQQVFKLSLNDRDLPLDEALLMARHEIPLPQLVKYVSLDSLDQGLQSVQLTTYRYVGFRDTVYADVQTVPFYYHPDGEK